MSWKKLKGNWDLKIVSFDIVNPVNKNSSGAILELEKKVRFDTVPYTFMVFEDSNDGYRSCSGSPLLLPNYRIEYLGIGEGGATMTYINQKVQIKCPDRADFVGIEMYDFYTKQLILRLGTGQVNDYYPYYCCEWTPENLKDNQK